MNLPREIQSILIDFLVLCLIILIVRQVLIDEYNANKHWLVGPILDGWGGAVGVSLTISALFPFISKKYQEKIIKIITPY
jgi:hypothetical protein